MKTAIFLGAGASASDGAPLQNKLFYEYFHRTHRVQVSQCLIMMISGIYLQIF